MDVKLRGVSILATGLTVAVLSAALLPLFAVPSCNQNCEKRHVEASLEWRVTGEHQASEERGDEW